MFIIDTGERAADKRVHLLAQWALDDYFAKKPRPTFSNGTLRRIELGLKHIAKNRPKQLAWAMQSLFRLASHLYFDRSEKTEAYRLLRTFHPVLPYVGEMNQQALEVLRQAQSTQMATG